ncbi:MAG: dihydroorotate dehydrogenase-like protein [Bacteroidales bacterium]|nr:dihydroorotate dehydrogenase-like protein [Bacteroidales bacterium]
MADLSVNYLGLKLNSPVIVSSSGLTDAVDKIVEIEKAGAGAVVLKSIFEEQLKHEANQYIVDNDYPEAEDYIRNYTRDNSVDKYLDLIEDAKKQVKIPVIASVNCVTSSEWVNFAKKIEEAGADALEVNVFFLPVNKEASSLDYEKVYCDLADELKQRLSIPVAFKLGRQFSNLTNLVNRLYHRKLDGVVLFNRFYEPDIDVDKLKLTAAEVFSTPSEIRQTLRWVGIVAGSVEDIDISASTGVHDGESVIKLLLAGASAVQVCSVLYKNGIPFLKSIINEIEVWMNKNSFNSIDDFKGKLSYRSIKDPVLYERSQFMRHFSNIH